MPRMRSSLQRLGLAFAMLVCSGCATEALWKSTDPGERVWVYASALSDEELLDRGADPDALERGTTDYVLVEKSAGRKFGEYAVLVAFTPIAVALDVTAVAAVIGFDLALSYVGAHAVDATPALGSAVR